MNELAAWLSNALLRTTIALSVALALACVVLWLTSCRSPSVRRAIWIIVLLQGWMFGRYAVDIPWYKAQAFQAHVAGGDPLLEGAMPPRLGPSDNAPLQPETTVRLSRLPLTSRRQILSPGTGKASWVSPGCLAA